MKKVLANSANKPEEARLAEKASTCIEELLSMNEEEIIDLSEYLSSEEIELLSKASDILMDLERDTTIAKRGY